MKGEIGISTIIVGDHNILFLIMNRTTRHKISKKTEDSNNTINQLDLADIKLEEKDVATILG